MNDNDRTAIIGQAARSAAKAITTQLGDDIAILVIVQASDGHYSVSNATDE
jgi:hypothetical protein